ncbi:MAG TPA: arginyltransferase [Stellaceae bacterium]|jgi:arginine-tRNA-protein transferase
MDGTVSGEDRGVGRKQARPVAREIPAATPLHFYRTASMPCPYVPGRVERKLVTELVGLIGAGYYNELSRGGFRRSHHLAYRPACAGCNACVPVRIVAPDFVPGRSLRRVAARNADVTVRIAEPKASVEQFRVFARYQHSRHHDSEMASMTYGDYRAMIEDSPVTTRLVELRGPDQRILGGCLVDLLDDGLSAVYSFYDPSDQRRGLGTYLILALIEETLRRQKPYVYLGYWIAESPKMAYKARFRPLEALSARGWNAMEA